MNLQRIRNDFPILNNVIYFNTGTMGITPRPVLEKLVKHTLHFENCGIMGLMAMLKKKEEGRDKLAKFLGAKPKEIIFTRNTTDAINLVIQSINWKRGDEVLISDQEHQAMITPLWYLQKYGGIKLKIFEMGFDQQKILTNIKEKITNKTRLISLSHVSCETGMRTPVTEIIEKYENRGIMTLLDGAQAIGQFPIDIDQIGCDFYTCCAHKWLLGPKGIGILYIASERVEELKPVFMGVESKACLPRKISNIKDMANYGQKLYSDTERIQLPQYAIRFEYGTLNLGTFASISSTLDWFGNIGWRNVEEHIRSMSNYLKKNLIKLSKVVIYTPSKWEHSSGIVSFSIDNMSCNYIVHKLWHDYKIITRDVEKLNAIRISLTVFNTFEEVDFLIEKLSQILSDKSIEKNYSKNKNNRCPNEYECYHYNKRGDKNKEKNTSSSTAVR